MTIPSFYNGQVLQGPELTLALQAASDDAQAAVASDLAAPSGAALVGIGVGRTQADKNAERLSVRDRGAKGDYVTDDTAAIIAADAEAAAAGKTLWFPAGVYGCTDGFTRLAHWAGEGAPQIAPFPLVGDDKQFLRPGYKGQIPGAVLIFKGTGTTSMSTQRSDGFASFTYCVRDAKTGLHMRDLAIVLDVDVYDAGGALTAYGADNSADYDVGHVIDDAAQCLTSDVCVFGYFPIAGTVIRSVLGADDPDYNIFRGGSTMGHIGLALIGSESNDGFDSGLSGTTSYGMDIYTLDHHDRSPATAPVIYANADTWRCVYIDGYTDAVNADLNGHYFFGGSIRTYAIHPIELDKASQANFVGVVHETSNYAGVPNAATKQWLASAETENVCITDSRFSSDAGLMSADFAGAMKGQLTIVGCPGLGFGNGIMVAEKDPGSSTPYWVKVGGASGGSGDPAIQFGSGSASNSTLGWSIRRDTSDASELEIRFDNLDLARLSTDGVWQSKRSALWGPTVLSVTSEAITVTQNSHLIGASGSPSVTTIIGGTEGEIIYLRKSGAGTVTLAEGGNIATPSTSVALTSLSDTVSLVKSGANWLVLSFSDNA